VEVVDLLEVVTETSDLILALAAEWEIQLQVPSADECRW
jgi:hypothetical protein